MDYERLQKNYWDQQLERVENLRQTIVARGDAITAGRTVPENTDLVIGTGRRLPMAVMFLDICGFSGRPSETHAEQDLLLRALNLFFTEMIKIAEEYGGVVEKNTGDGLMAYFNDGEGNPPENGCKRAVTCALTMMHANTRLINPILKASNIAELQFRIGIDHGSVTIAQLGAARRFGSLAAVGSTANVACKMLAVADPNEIIIGENVFSQLPLLWRTQYCRIKQENTGWNYIGTGAPYRFFDYFGRWIPPQ